MKSNKKYHPEENLIAEQPISDEDAAESAREWLGEGSSLMQKWLIAAILDKRQHRDIGKILSGVAEIHVNSWIAEQARRPIKSVVGEAWDSITVDEPIVKIQIKFRMRDWHFETTRRHSKKNADTNSTGHVAYRVGEFDLVAIFKPSRSFGITGSTIRCIPAAALVDPIKQHQMLTSIPAKIRRVYDTDEKTKEVLKEIFQTPPLPRDLCQTV